jgi:hypothetical protein
MPSLVASSLLLDIIDFPGAAVMVESQWCVSTGQELQWGANSILVRALER